MRAAENDFEGYSDDNSTGKGREGAFVRVHAGRGQATFCAGAHRTWSGSLHQRAGAVHAQDADGRWSRRCEDGEARKSAAHAQDADGQWNRRCEDGGSRKRCEDGGARAGGNGTSSLIGLSSFAGAAHAKDANGQWSRRCEDGVAQAHDADGQWNRRCEDGGTRKRCEDGGVRRIIGSKQGRTIWGSMDTVAWSMMDAAAVGSSAGP